MNCFNYAYYYLIGLLYPVLKLEDGEPNYAKGEIEKFNLIESQKNYHKIGDQVVGSKKGYDCIWICLGNDYFKLICKTKERTC